MAHVRFTDLQIANNPLVITITAVVQLLKCIYPTHSEPVYSLCLFCCSLKACADKYQLN